VADQFLFRIRRQI